MIQLSFELAALLSIISFHFHLKEVDPNMLFQCLSVILIGCLTLIYLKVSRKHRLFQDLGLKAVDPGIFPLGSEPLWSIVVKGVNYSRAFDKQFKKFGMNPMYAYYGFLGMPFLVLQDMDLIKDVLIKDFDHFLDRRFENSSPIGTILSR